MSDFELYVIAEAASLSTARSSISTTGTGVSPRTNIPAGSGFPKGMERRQSVYRGWASISSAGDSQIGVDKYKPDVKLQYHDESGREMPQKEAFKHLSRAFQGRKRESRFKAEMEVCTPEGRFGSSGSGYEGGDERES